jgi:hypothetical protein
LPVCRKTRYATHEQAVNAMWRMVRTKIGYGKLPCRAYDCPDCGAWHLTSMALPDKVSA